MPGNGRPRLIASKSCSAKLFVDDLCEVIKLSQPAPIKTINDTLRELVYEVLVNRHQIAFMRDQNEAQFTSHQPSKNGRCEIKTLLTKLVAQRPSQQVSPQLLLTESLGFAIAAEGKSHLLLQNFLLSRGVSEEISQVLIAEQETRSRKHVNPSCFPSN
jgi:hypothetical protein